MSFHTFTDDYFFEYLMYTNLVSGQQFNGIIEYNFKKVFDTLKFPALINYDFIDNY